MYMKDLAITHKIFEHNAGLMKDLESAITIDEIRRLERLGYIENAISPKGATWKLSKKGKESRELLVGKATLFDKISDFFYRYILKYRVSL